MNPEMLRVLSILLVITDNAPRRCCRSLLGVVRGKLNLPNVKYYIDARVTGAFGVFNHDVRVERELVMQSVSPMGQTVAEM